MKVKSGDIVLVDESLEKDYYTRKYKAVVLWDSPFQQQPLLTNINEWRPHWGCYRHIAKIIDHIDLQQAIALLQEQEPVPVDTKMIGMPNGTDIEVYCCRDCRAVLDPAFNYCPNCGQAVKWNDNDRY